MTPSTEPAASGEGGGGGARLAERIKAVIDREVYCTVVIRPEHDPNCQGDCGRYGCPIPVQDYGDTADLARAIAEELTRPTPPAAPLEATDADA